MLGFEEWRLPTFNQSTDLGVRGSCSRTGVLIAGF
jgi:hypothetical protein